MDDCIVSPRTTSRSKSFAALERAQTEVSPDAVTLAVMITGATDSSFLKTKGVQAYGIGAPKTEEESRGVHGNRNDERIEIKQLGLFVRYLFAAAAGVAAQQ